jgi:hypothetical protein
MGSQYPNELQKNEWVRLGGLGADPPAGTFWLEMPVSIAGHGDY